MVVLCAHVLCTVEVQTRPLFVHKWRWDQGARGKRRVGHTSPHPLFAQRWGGTNPCAKEGGQSTPCPAHGEQGGAKMGPAVGEKGGVDSEVILLSTPPFLLGHWWGRMQQ
jgi:hypothetical protein